MKMKLLERKVLKPSRKENCKNAWSYVWKYIHRFTSSSYSSAHRLRTISERVHSVVHSTLSSYYQLRPSTFKNAYRSLRGWPNNLRILFPIIRLIAMHSVFVPLQFTLFHLRSFNFGIVAWLLESNREIWVQRVCKRERVTGWRMVWRWRKS
jgi:hypothetical protein